MRCSGFNATSGAFVELSGDAILAGVEEQISAPAYGTFVAPGFIEFR